MALLLASFFVGVANHMTLEAVLKSILKGIGDTAGSLLLILVFGAMLGKLIEESGAAYAISYKLTDLFGLRRIQLSVCLTGRHRPASHQSHSGGAISGGFQR